MKYLFLFIAMILAANTSIFAQNDKSPGCPALSVTGPAAVPKAGDTILFSLSFTPPIDQSQLTFQWTTSDGEIVEGQGKRFIRVKVNPDGQSITATVKILGLPEGCESMASENVGCGLTPPTAERLAITGWPFTQEDKVKFTRIRETMKQDLDSRILVFYGPGLARRQKEIKDSIAKNAGLENTDKVTLVEVESSLDRLEVWRVPPGAPDPRLENGKIVP